MSRFASVLVLFVGVVGVAVALPPYLGFPYATTAFSYSLPYRAGFAYGFPKAVVPAVAGYAAPAVAGIVKPFPVPALPGVLPAGYASPIPPVGYAAGPYGAVAPAVGPVAPAVGPYGPVGPAYGPVGPVAPGYGPVAPAGFAPAPALLK